MPLWFVITKSLKPALFSCCKASTTPSKISTARGSEQKSTSRMMVPSRSRKTAACNPSMGARVILKTGAQFFHRRRRRSKLSNNNGTGVVCNFRGFNRGCVATKCQGEKRNCSVAGARHIEDLLRFRRDVMRRFAFLKQHHSLFAERNEQQLRIPFLEQRFSDFD